MDPLMDDLVAWHRNLIVRNYSTEVGEEIAARLEERLARSVRIWGGNLSPESEGQKFTKEGRILSASRYFPSMYTYCLHATSSPRASDNVYDQHRSQGWRNFFDSVLENGYESIDSVFARTFGTVGNLFALTDEAFIRDPCLERMPAGLHRANLIIRNAVKASDSIIFSSLNGIGYG